jgi:NADH dehydrogenase
VLRGVELVAVDFADNKSLAAALDGCSTLINLAGILNQTRAASFQQVHVALVERLVDVAPRSGITRFLHMSALNADEARGSSQYLRSKGKGENTAHTLGGARMAVTSFRPSVIFGRDDSFVNRFAQLLRIPGPMPLACPQARFAPVAIEDVCSAFLAALQNSASHGQAYDLCGPDQYSLRELVDLIAAELGIVKSIIGLSDRMSRLQARVLEYAPGKPFTFDNYLSLQTPSICAEDGLARLGITPHRLEAALPAILGHSADSLIDRLRRSRAG